MPILNGSPGELTQFSFFVGEHHVGDVFDACVTRVALRDVDRSEDFHFDIDRWTFTANAPVIRVRTSVPIAAVEFQGWDVRPALNLEASGGDSIVGLCCWAETGFFVACSVRPQIGPEVADGQRTVPISPSVRRPRETTA